MRKFSSSVKLKTLTMEAIESLVTQIKSLPGNKNDITHLLNALKQADESLHSHSARLSPFLDQLDPSEHSLGYLYILEAYVCCPVQKENCDELIVRIGRFIHSCNAAHIQLVPDKFISICKKLKDIVMKVEAPIRGINPLRTAIRKLQPSSECLTTLHSDFLLICLLAKCYSAALSILDDRICEVPQPTDHFLYCYYGGMICIGLKRFPKALELLHNAITAPMSTINAIAVEAFKKYILVSLIHHGQINPNAVNFLTKVDFLQKFPSTVAQRNLKNFCPLYIGLATSYSKGSIAEIERSIEEHTAMFERDKNLGLVKQVLSSMNKRNIQRLTQTYLTLSLQDIANIVQLNSPREAEMQVLQMIQDGDIYATINQKDGMVRFLEDPEQYKSCEMVEHINSSIQRMVTLSKKLTSMDELISSNHLYLSKVGQERQRYDYDDLDSVTHKFNI